MPNIKVTALVSSAFMITAAPALASITIVNETDKKHTVTFDMGAVEKKYELEPGAEASHSCAEQCGVRFAGHDAMAVDGDKLAIRESNTRPVVLSN